MFLHFGPMAVVLNAPNNGAPTVLPEKTTDRKDDKKAYRATPDQIRKAVVMIYPVRSMDMARSGHLPEEPPILGLVIDKSGVILAPKECAYLHDKGGFIVLDESGQVFAAEVSGVNDMFSVLKVVGHKDTNFSFIRSVAYPKEGQVRVTTYQNEKVLLEGQITGSDYRLIGERAFLVWNVKCGVKLSAGDLVFSRAGKIVGICIGGGASGGVILTFHSNTNQPDSFVARGACDCKISDIKCCELPAGVKTSCEKGVLVRLGSGPIYPGDIITSVNGISVTSSPHFVWLIQNSKDSSCEIDHLRHNGAGYKKFTSSLALKPMRDVKFVWQGVYCELVEEPCQGWAVRHVFSSSPFFKEFCGVDSLQIGDIIIAINAIHVSNNQAMEAEKYQWDSYKKPFLVEAMRFVPNGQHIYIKRYFGEKKDARD